MTIYLPAQHTGSYKYITSQRDSCVPFNLDAIEVDNHYYLLTDLITVNFYLKRIPTVTVFDESLNIVKQIELFDSAVSIRPMELFYHNHSFYFAGLHSEIQRAKPFLMKFDQNFNLLQTSVFTLEDTSEYGCCDILMNSNNEFVYFLIQRDNIYQGRLLHVNTNGVILQNAFFPNKNFLGSIAETDNHYFVDMGKDYLLKFCKDSINKIDSLPITVHEDDSPEGTLISVGNHLIRSNIFYTFRDECGEYPPLEMDRSIVFLDTNNIQEKKRLEFGMSCIDDGGIGYWNMDYIHSDSIYYAYTSSFKSFEDAIGIANFSQDGDLNFNYTLDISEDSLTSKTVYGCRALSDGGALVYGIAREMWENGITKGFLLKYHPQRNDLNLKEFPIDESIKIYPNPARSQFTITNTENATIYLYNILGQKITQITGKEQNTIIQTENLPAGIYVVKIEKGNTVFTKKVQILQ